MGADALTRRQVLLAAAVTIGAAVSPLSRSTAARAADGLRLHPGRAATYRRLVAALQRVPESQRGGRRRAGAATRDFARWYEGQDETVRAHADAVLDALATRTPSFSGRPADAALGASALGLAAIGCEPSPGDDERPPVTCLGRPS